MMMHLCVPFVSLERHAWLRPSGHVPVEKGCPVLQCTEWYGMVRNVLKHSELSTPIGTLSQFRNDGNDGAVGNTRHEYAALCSMAQFYSLIIIACYGLYTVK
jgi:hypothetical protein